MADLLTLLVWCPDLAQWTSFVVSADVKLVRDMERHLTLCSVACRVAACEESGADGLDIVVAAGDTVPPARYVDPFDV